MAKAFSVAPGTSSTSRAKASRPGVENVVEFLAGQRPNVFALYEVEGREVFDALTKLMPEYTFHITEGQQVRRSSSASRTRITAFFTQKTEFRSGVSLLRPGALLTVTIDGVNYTLLFLHTKERHRTGAGSGCATTCSIASSSRAKRKKMKVLDKDEPNTWWGGGKLAPSNLDFVVARDHIPFKKFAGSEVSVRGWPKIAEPDEQLRWVREMSDHGLLFFEVQRPPQ
jgi:hypothetical protein